MDVHLARKSMVAVYFANRSRVDTCTWPLSPRWIYTLFNIKKKGALNQ